MTYHGADKIVEISKDLSNGVWLEVGYDEIHDEVLVGAEGVGSKSWTNWLGDGTYTACYVDRPVTRAALIRLIEDEVMHRYKLTVERRGKEPYTVTVKASSPSMAVTKYCDRYKWRADISMVSADGGQEWVHAKVDTDGGINCNAIIDAIIIDDHND